MVINFDERYSMLIDKNVPRKFLISEEELDYRELLKSSIDCDFPFAQDGFIAQYCINKEK